MKSFGKWLVAIIGAASLMQNAQAAEPLFADKVLVKGKGVELKQSELDDAILGLRATMAAQGQTLSEADRVRLRTNLVDRIVLSRLIVNRATADEKSEAKKAAEKVVEEAKKRAPNEEAFKRRLEAVGMKYETFLQRAEEEMIVRKVVERELANTVVISEDAIKKFYSENEKAFDQPEMVKAAHVLLVTLDSTTRTDLPEDQKKEKRAKADQVLMKAKAGEDFAKLAKEFSEDRGSKDNGGEYTFPRGKMEPEFEAVAFALLPGQISDVVTSKYGYHIIKVIEKMPARKIPLTEVSSRIKDSLQAQEVQKQLPAYYKKVKDEAKLEYFLDEEK
ncbi:MAG TPA: peptidylprolyl isomerase [Verrucomicrobiae bacterium]